MCLSLASTSQSKKKTTKACVILANAFYFDPHSTARQTNSICHNCLPQSQCAQFFNDRLIEWVAFSLIRSIRLSAHSSCTISINFCVRAYKAINFIEINTNCSSGSDCLWLDWYKALTCTLHSSPYVSVPKWQCGRLAALLLFTCLPIAFWLVPRAFCQASTALSVLLCGFLRLVTTFANQRAPNCSANTYISHCY